jgi:GDPmannose 4,6-dehydratase
MSSQKVAVITGITGQDGAYLAKFLLAEKNYIVYGTYRRTSSTNFWRLEALGVKDHPNLHLVEHDLTDLSVNIRLLEKIQPTEVYNLAAQSFVGVSFEQPITTAQITGLGPLNILEAIRIVNPQTRFYQASTSEMFGKVQAIPQTENTSFYPRSPYGVAKLFAHWMTINYAESYGIYACSGILFNHESPLRGEEFVTRKITSTLAKIKHGAANILELGNLDAQRDWGHAKDYVIGMWAMLQQNQPEAYILATGKTKTVREFLNIAAEEAGFLLKFQGQGKNEVGIDQHSGKTIVRINPNFYRPAEVDLLIGDASKAAKNLQWKSLISVEELAREMMQFDLGPIHD